MEKINILVIDDDQAMLDWFKVLNSPKSPFAFYTLKNEIKAAQAVEKITPQLVFLDISLNALDGPIIASIINGHNIPNSRIVTMSADIKNKKSVNAENFLLKPLTKEMVMGKIQEILKI